MTDRLVQSGFTQKDGFHGNYEHISKAQSSDLLPFNTFDNSGGNDFIPKSHPIKQKDVKKEIEDADYDFFADPEAPFMKPTVTKCDDLNDEDDDSFDGSDSDDDDQEDDDDDNIFEDDALERKLKPGYEANYPLSNPEDELGPHGHDNMNPGVMDGNYIQNPIALMSPEQIEQFGYDSNFYPQGYCEGMYAPHPHMSAEMYKYEQEMGGYGYPDAAYYNLPHMGGYEDSKDFRLYRHSSNKGRKRSKYRMLPVDVKRTAVEMAMKNGCKAAAHRLNVPLKSLKRWMKVGCERKKGGGRKTKDPLMEKRLYDWYIDMKNAGQLVTAKMIKEKAMELTNCSDFIASKGWLDKFKVRYSLEISKESNKDGIRRKGSVHHFRKSKERYQDSIDSDPYFESQVAYPGFRRSITKSMKNEIKQESNLKQDPYDRSKVKCELWEESKPQSGAFKNKNEISSIFQSYQKGTTITKHINESGCNAKSVPLCEETNSDLDFTS